MARLVVGVAAGIVGFYIGGPVGALQGFTIGYGLAAGLDPNAKVLGPKLTDLKAPSATYGSPIAYVEGAPRLAGCVIWSSDKRAIATTTSEGGKGGPGVDSTTFTYELDIGIELAINRCEAIRRVWSNGKLVWSNADDSDAETVTASSLTNSWRDMRFYDGNPAQLPDPTYEALVGIGNAPAYRTRTTVVLEGLNLGGSGQLPVLTFEVVTEADRAYSTTTFATLPMDAGLVMNPNVAGISAMSPAGFDVLYGINFNTGNASHTGYTVFRVASDGSITQGATFTYWNRVGNREGKDSTPRQLGRVGPRGL